MLTKSDFLQFLDAPMHLWALKHDKLTIKTPSTYDQHLMQQGYEVEKLAHDFLPLADWQKTFTWREFEARTDAIIKNPDGGYDIYEIKSTTDVEKEHLYDAAFQSLIVSQSEPVNKIFIVTLNKDYIFDKKLDTNAIFTIHNTTEQVNELSSFIESQMNLALMNSKAKVPDHVECCLSPKTCPCLDLCHPNLPEKSIFNIPSLTPTKKRELVDSKIIDIQKLPPSFTLTPKQKKIVDVLKTDTPYLNSSGLKNFLNNFEYPLYFLDYETYPLAIPIYNGYKPHQHMVFQYSIHKIEKDGDIYHFEYLETENVNPSVKLLEKLSNDLGQVGNVLVWNKTFEYERNKDMARVYPEYKEFLEQVNERMVDLADFINKGYYIHPEFLGSWSIKNVLPVMVPDLSYKNLKVNKGDMAMLAWWELIHSKDKSTASDLLEYCGLDTLAMVKIWEKLKTLTA